MEGILDKIVDFLLKAPDYLIYIFLFASAIIENLFPPIPGDTITAFGAFLVGTGRLDYLIVYIITSAGSVLGFMSLFFLGKYLGRTFFIEKDYKFFSKESIQNSEKWFRKYGYFVVFGNRFLPGIRSVISIVTGISRLSTLRVFLLSSASALVWNLLWIHAGYTLGDNWDIVKEKFGAILKGYNIIISIFLILALGAYFILKKIKSSSK